MRQTLAHSFLNLFFLAFAHLHLPFLLAHLPTTSVLSESRLPLSQVIPPGFSRTYFNIHRIPRSHRAIKDQPTKVFLQVKSWRHVNAFRGQRVDKRAPTTSSSSAATTPWRRGIQGHLQPSSTNNNNCLSASRQARSKQNEMKKEKKSEANRLPLVVVFVVFVSVSVVFVPYKA